MGGVVPRHCARTGCRHGGGGRSTSLRAEPPSLFSGFYSG